MNREDIARVCHEVNRSYCQSLGDMSQPLWDDAPDWMKESAMKGVELHLTQLGAGPETSHKSWMQEKIDTNWTYGEVKDEVAKTHPCLVQFDELPVDQQAKDYIFRQIVHSLKWFL
jgi:hypothetical protein